MPFIRGDAHKFYLELQKVPDKHANRKLREVATIKSFYQSLDEETLRLAYYRMVKEQNGSGIIPLYVTAIPWLLFLFSSKVQDYLFHDGHIVWAVVFISIYLILLVVSTFYHFGEKAWAALHIEIILDVLGEHKKKD